MAVRTIDYTAHLEAEDDITPAATKAAKALDKLESQGDITVKFRGDTSQVARDIDQVLAKVDKLAGTGSANLVLTSNASQITNEIGDLVTELNQLDANDPNVEIRVQNIADLEQGLDRLQTKAKELNDTPLQLGGGKGGGDGFTKIIDGADQANSAVANMVGNASQDMGELVGVTGSAGVAVGQLSEYFTDSAFSAKAAGQSYGEIFKSFAAAAGPIAAISAAIFLVTSAAEAYGAPAKKAAERTKELSAAMNEGGDASLAFAKVLRDASGELSNFIADANDPLGGFGTAVDDAASKVPLIGKYFKEAGVDVYDAMSKAGLSVYDMSKAMDKGRTAADAFNVQLAAAKEAGLISEDQYNAVSEALDKYSDAAGNAAKDAGLFNVSIDEANAMLADGVPPLEQYTELWNTLIADMADGTVDTQGAADAVNTLGTELGLTREEVIGLAKGKLDETLQSGADAAANLAEGMANVNDAFEGIDERVAALGSAFESFNAKSDLDFSAMASNTVQSFDDIKAALKDVQDIGSKPLVPTSVESLRGLSDESAKVIDTIGGMRSAIQTELGAALADAGGNFDGLREKAAFFNTEVTDQFTKAFTDMGLGPAEVESKVTELLGSLGLLPSQVETVIKVTEAEEATRKIELFGSALDSLPPETLAQVTAAVDANDPVTAWNLIKSSIDAQGAVPAAVDAVPGADTATPAIEAVAAGDYNATVDAGANVKPGAATLDSFTGQKRAVDPVKVDANTAAAINTMLYLRILAALLQPVVTVTTNIAPAMAGIATVAGQRPQVPVNAYLHDYPSASEIAARIGVVRVPVDAYVRTSPRINGAVP